jgi:hypothetical protein
MWAPPEAIRFGEHGREARAFVLAAVAGPRLFRRSRVLKKPRGREVRPALAAERRRDGTG